MKVPPIVYILLFAALAVGGWYVYTQQPELIGLAPDAPQTEPAPTGSPPPAQPQSSAPAVPTATPDQPPAPALKEPARLKLDGSTSMVVINKALSIGYQQKYPGSSVTYSANGTSNGIAALLRGEVDIAAASRALNPDEAQQGLTATPVAADEIAVVVGVGNPFKEGLTNGQLVDIFSGRVTNWSEVGGPPQPLTVINRNPASGTYQFFREVVLSGGPFGSGPNITTLSRDETTPLLRALGTTGIGYATATQVTNQKTVRVVPINGAMPGAGEQSDYPLQRSLYYVYRGQSSPQVQSFLEYALSEDGKKAIRRYGF